MHGANAPLMMKIMTEEIEKEKKVMAGQAERLIIHLEECIPGTVIWSAIPIII